ncbi:MAG TPA: hypothetical protein VGK19_18265 [Capsulimonadaceae bacterium]
MNKASDTMRIIDVRFSDINHVVYALDDYLLALEAHIETLPKYQSDIAHQRLTEGDLWEDEAEVSLAFQLSGHYGKDLFPRMIRNSFVVSLWSIYEGAARNISDFVQRHDANATKFDDPTQNAKPTNNSGNVLQRLRRHYKSELIFNLCEAADYEHLNDLLLLRNIIAHDNGSVERTRRKASGGKHLQRILDRHDGVTITRFEDSLDLNSAYVGRACKLVTSSLEGLIDRARIRDDALILMMKKTA